jgi:nitrate/nitrite-specific signal transduction histidine kinase
MSDDPATLVARGEEFLQAFRRGIDFTRELLHENERLRRQLAELERLDEVEQENGAFADRYFEIEQENNDLANLYVASYQLHSTLDLDEVVRIIIEIAINLIGADRFAIYVIDERRQELRVLAAEGVEPGRLPACRPGEGRIGSAVGSETTSVWDPDPARAGEVDLERPLVCIPLRVERQPLGVIAIFGLLQQKQGFSSLDHELFSVLAGHAATAIFAARLYSQSECKLSTIQGFLDLLTR